MRRNPVYSREMKANARSARLSVVLLLFNMILSAVALFNMYTVVDQARVSASIQYSSFMEMYEFVTTIEFVMLMFIVPAVTAASISGERERQTLDLMLTTQITAAQVVIGKLMGALSTLLLLILSSFPVVALVLVFGGVTWLDVIALLFCYVTVALFGGSLGLCFSSLFKRSTLATVVTYGVLAAIVGGTYFINRFSLSLSEMSLRGIGYGADIPQASAGGSFYLFLFNPVVTFMGIVSRQIGGNRPMSQVGSYFGMRAEGFVMEQWIPISIVLQLAAALAFLAVAVYFVEPLKRGRQTRREDRHKKRSRP